MQRHGKKTENDSSLRATVPNLKKERGEKGRTGKMGSRLSGV